MNCLNNQICFHFTPSRVSISSIPFSFNLSRILSDSANFLAFLNSSLFSIKASNSLEMLCSCFSKSKTLKIINNTNYPNKTRIVLDVPEGAEGETNFWLELKWTGSVLLTVELPIIIEGETYDD